MSRLVSKVAKVATPCWENAQQEEHTINPGERYYSVNDHGTVMNFCERCHREALEKGEEVL